MAQVPPNPAKSYIAYDEYILHQPNGNHVVFDDVGLAWIQFKKENQMVFKLNWSSKDVDNVPYLPGETSDQWYYLPSEISLMASRSLLKMLRMIELDGCYIDALTEGILCVYPSMEVKVKGVQILTRQNLDDATFEAHLRCNYKAAASIIESLFLVHGTLCVPPDISHLLQLMKNHFEDRELFPIHAGLVPMISYSALSKECLDILESKINDSHYHNICEAVVASLGDDWRVRVNENNLLCHTYYYFNQGRQYELPRNKKNQKHLTGPQKAALQAVNLTSQNKRRLNQSEINVIDGHKLLTFLRNRTAHRMEAIRASYVTWNNKEKYNFSATSTEIITRAKFDLVLPIIQIHLHRNGYLSKLKLGGLF